MRLLPPTLMLFALSTAPALAESLRTQCWQIASHANEELKARPAPRQLAVQVSAKEASAELGIENGTGFTFIVDREDAGDVFRVIASIFADQQIKTLAQSSGIGAPIYFGLRAFYGDKITFTGKSLARLERKNKLKGVEHEGCITAGAELE